MSLGDLTGDSILDAVKEYDALGRVAVKIMALCFVAIGRCIFPIT